MQQKWKLKKMAHADAFAIAIQCPSVIVILKLTP